MKILIFSFVFLQVSYFAFSQNNEQNLRADLNSCLSIIGQNLPNDYQKWGNSNTQYSKEYSQFRSIAIIENNKIVEIHIRFDNNIDYATDIYPRFWNMYAILESLGSYIGIYNNYTGFKLPNNKYALFYNNHVNINDRQQYRPQIALMTNVNENLFKTSTLSTNFDLNIINNCLNMFGNRIPSDFVNVSDSSYSIEYSKKLTNGEIRLGVRFAGREDANTIKNNNESIWFESNGYDNIHQSYLIFLRIKEYLNSNYIFINSKGYGGDVFRTKKNDRYIKLQLAYSSKEGKNQIWLIFCSDREEAKGLLRIE